MNHQPKTLYLSMHKTNTMNTFILEDKSGGQIQETSCRLSKTTLTDIKRLAYAGTKIDTILKRMIFVLKDQEHLLYKIKEFDQIENTDYPNLENLKD